jgi:hypothetical protein
MFKVAVEETNVWICTKHRPSPLEKDKRMRPKMISYHGNAVYHYNINLMNSEQGVQVSDTTEAEKIYKSW